MKLLSELFESLLNIIPPINNTHHQSIINSNISFHHTNQVFPKSKSTSNQSLHLYPLYSSVYNQPPQSLIHLYPLYSSAYNSFIPLILFSIQCLFIYTPYILQDTKFENNQQQLQLQPLPSHYKLRNVQNVLPLLHY